VIRGLPRLQSDANNQRTYFFEFHTLHSVPEGPVLIGAHHKGGEGLKIAGPQGGTTTAQCTTTENPIFLR
jgi:hypothetical protein